MQSYAHPTQVQSDVSDSIRITFSIADLHTLSDDADPYADDPALHDEDSASIPEEGQSGGAQSKDTINQGHTRGGNIKVAPEDSVAPADGSESADDESPYNEEDAAGDTAFSARVNVTIEKAGQGALQIETVAQDGMIVIDNVYYFPNAELADAKSADQDWTRRGLYTGPPFGNLDQDLQVLLEKYLEERGVNTALALWVPEYIDFKEQREYLNWLASKFSPFSPMSTGSRLTAWTRCQVIRRCLIELFDSMIPGFSFLCNNMVHSWRLSPVLFHRDCSGN